MKGKKYIAGLAVTGGLLLVANLYTARTPDYGIRSKWKKLLLKTMLSDEVPKISAADAHAKKGSVLFVDTREREEYKVSHIEGALFVGYKQFDLPALENLPRNKPIVIYCSIGKRSDAIAKQLMDVGFRNVQNLYGGIFEWINKGYTVVDNENKPTEKVHAFNTFWGKWLHRGEKVY
jgi:rhodanese-related sulfurtransferase